MFTDTFLVTEMMNLELVSLEYCKIDDDNMKTILVTLENYYDNKSSFVMSLKNVNLGKNDISNALTWKKVFNYFIKSKYSRVEKLNLNSNRLSNKMIAHLTKYIQKLHEKKIQVTLK